MKRYAKGLMALVLAGFVLLAAGSCTGQKGEETLYHCPMHPTVVANHPGDCPICGMKLVPVEKATPADTPKPQEGKKPLFYRNPMDPTVTSPVPMKDPMGMDYIPVFADELEEKSQVAGYAPVRLEPLGISRSGIQTSVAERGTLGEAIRAVGIVLPDERLVTHVHTKVSGWVEKLFVNFTGQWVESGQPLLTLYSPELLASQLDYLRAKDLAKRVVAATSQESTQNLVQAARQRLLLFDVPEDFLAQLDATGQPIRAVTLRSARRGYVLAKNTFPGLRVEPGMELYTVADLSRVWVEADFYEREAPVLSVGLKGHLSLPYQPTLQLEAPITYVYPTLEPTSRTVRARFEVNNREGKFKPGMYANVEVVVEPVEGVIVPDSAVIDTGTRQVAFVEDRPGFFVPREVVVARRSSGKALITQGLAPDERVVVQGTFLLDSESRLKAAIAAAQETSHDQGHH